MWGCVPVSHATLPPCLSAPVRDPRALNDLHELKMGMACCHSLTKVEGELSGDPLDLEVGFDLDLGLYLNLGIYIDLGLHLDLDL